MTSHHIWSWFHRVAQILLFTRFIHQQQASLRCFHKQSHPQSYWSWQFLVVLILSSLCISIFFRCISIPISQHIPKLQTFYNFNKGLSSYLVNFLCLWSDLDYDCIKTLIVYRLWLSSISESFLDTNNTKSWLHTFWDCTKRLFYFVLFSISSNIYL